MNDNHVTGSISAKRGKFYITIYYYQNGERLRKSFPTGISVEENNKRKMATNKKAAEKMMKEIMANFIAPAPSDPSEEQSIDDSIRDWLKKQENRVAPSTFTGYTYAANDLITYFTTHPIKLIEATPQAVHDYIDWEYSRRKPGPNQSKQTKSPDGAGINNTIMRRIAVLRSVLQDAKRNGIIEKNPAAASDSWVKLPKIQRASFQVLNGDEAQTLLAAIEQEPLWFKAAIFLGLLYGLRRSEILGIRIQDIDFPQRRLSVCNTVTQQTIHNKNIITAKPKTKGTKLRTFTLSPQVVTLLQSLIDLNNANLLQFGKAYDNSWAGYIFRDIDGQIIAPNRLTNSFKNFLVANNLKIIRFHDLRHSCASLLYAQGVSTKTIQTVLGHSALSTTTEVYTHLFGREKDDALEALSNTLIPIQNNKDGN